MKNKTTAGVLAIFLGGIGAHKFYLRKYSDGIVFILFCWTLIPAIAGIITGISLLFLDQEKFDAKYNDGKKSKLSVPEGLDPENFRKSINEIENVISQEKLDDVNLNILIKHLDTIKGIGNFSDPEKLRNVVYNATDQLCWENHHQLNISLINTSRIELDNKLYQRLGRSQCEVGDIEKGLANLKKSASGSNFNALKTYYIQLFKAKRYDELIENAQSFDDFFLGMMKKENYYTVPLFLGKSLMEKREYELAIAAFKTVPLNSKKFNKEINSINKNIGKCYEQINKPKMAIKAYESVLSKDYSNKEVHELLDRLRNQIKDKNDALKKGI